MTDDDELKPCPFCGGEAAILDADYVSVGWNEGYRRAYVACNSCGASGRKIRVTNYYGEPEGTVRDAVDAWNRRTETDKTENLCKLVIQLWSLLSVKGYGDEASKMLCDGADEIFDPKDIDRRIKELRLELGIGAEQ